MSADRLFKALSVFPACLELGGMGRNDNINGMIMHDAVIIPVVPPQPALLLFECQQRLKSCPAKSAWTAVQKNLRWRHSWLVMMQVVIFRAG